MVEPFGCWALCPSWPLRQKKRTVWNQTFLKSESGEEIEQTTLSLSCLRCSYSVAGLWVSFSFPFRFKLMSCASELEHMNGFLSFVIWWNKLKWTEDWVLKEIVKNVSLYLFGFGPQNSFTMKACTEFYCRQIAEKSSLKLRLIQTSLLFFWSVSECRVPLFNQLIQLPLG